MSPYSPSHCGGAEQIIRGNRPDDIPGDGYTVSASLGAATVSVSDDD